MPCVRVCLGVRLYVSLFLFFLRLVHLASRSCPQIYPRGKGRRGASEGAATSPLAAERKADGPPPPEELLRTNGPPMRRLSELTATPKRLEVPLPMYAAQNSLICKIKFPYTRFEGHLLR